MSRAPTHSTAGQTAPGKGELEELEELGDDAIIAQQRGAHAPQRRAHVADEARSVVIAEAGRPRGERTEKTVVIRDRRALEEMRRQIVESQRRKKRGNRSLWIWVAVGVFAFVTGAIVALVATRVPALDAEPQRGQGGSAATAPSTSSSSEPPLLDIEQLPLETGKKK